MAMAIRCDRCNAYFQFSKKQPNAVAVSCIDYRGNIDSSCGNGWRDLCPECMDAFNAWMQGAVKESEES